MGTKPLQSVVETCDDAEIGERGQSFGSRLGVHRVLWKMPLKSWVQVGAPTSYYDFKVLK